jgi:hypothetical protein
MEGYEMSEEIELAFLYLQDMQRYISAGKVQRWEVMKWSVSANLALAAAALATTAAKWAMFGFCVFVSAISVYLLHHYNDRLTKVRKAADEIMDRLSLAHPDIEKLAGKERYPSGPDELKDYDKQEMTLFVLIISLSVVPALSVWAGDWASR